MDKTLDEEFYGQRIRNNLENRPAANSDKVMLSRVIKVSSDHIVQGYEFWASMDKNQGDYPRCVLRLKKALAMTPDDWRIAEQLGKCLSEFGCHSKALNYFIRALGICPTSISVHENFIKTLESLGKSEEIESHYEDFLNQNPEIRTDDLFYYMKTKALLNLDKYALCLLNAKKALELRPKDANIHILCSQALYYQGNLSESLQEIERALLLSPEDHSTRNNVFFLKYNLGQVKEAIMGFEEAIEKRRATDYTYFNLIVAQYHLHHNEDVIKPHIEKLKHYKRKNLETLQKTYRKELTLTEKKLTEQLDETQRDFFERKFKGVKFVLSFIESSSD